MSTFWTAENFYSGAVVDMTNFESIFLRGSSGHSGAVVDKRPFWGEIVVHYSPGGLYLGMSFLHSGIEFQIILV